MTDKLIFADGLESLAFDRNLVKMEFFSKRADPSSKDENTQIHENTGRLVMHVEDFSNFYNALTELVSTLEEKKILVKHSSIKQEATPSGSIY